MYTDMCARCANVHWYVAFVASTKILFLFVKCKRDQLTCWIENSFVNGIIRKKSSSSLNWPIQYVIQFCFAGTLHQQYCVRVFATLPHVFIWTNMIEDFWCKRNFLYDRGPMLGESPFPRKVSRAWYITDFSGVSLVLSFEIFLQMSFSLPVSVLGVFLSLWDEP